MTTSILNPENDALITADLPTRPAKASNYTTYRIRHTLASRFAFLIICTAIVLSALVYGTVHYWALALFFLGGVSVVILWAVDCWILGSVRISRNLLQIPLIGMLLLGLFQLLPLRSWSNAGVLSSAAINSLSFDPYSTRLVLVQVGALLLYFAAALVFVDTPKRLRVLVRTIVIFGFILAIFGLTQSFTSPNKVFWVREMAQSTHFGPFINRHHFAGYMELALAIPLGLVFTGGVEREKSFLYVFAALLMAIALMMTNSRGGIISLGAEIVFLVATMGLHQRKKKRSSRQRWRIKSAALKAGLALALVLIMFVGVVLFGGEDALSRLVGSVNTDDPTTGRAHFWSVTVDIIKNHPLAGVGLGAFGVVYTGYDSQNGAYRLEQVHNDYLQVFSDGGIIGAALALFFVICLFRLGFMRRDSRDDFRRGVATGALAGCFAVLVHSFFDFTLHTTSNALLFLILAAVATMNGRVEDVHGRRSKRNSRSRREISTNSVEPKALSEAAP